MIVRFFSFISKCNFHHCLIPIIDKLRENEGLKANTSYLKQTQTSLIVLTFSVNTKA